MSFGGGSLGRMTKAWTSNGGAFDIAGPAGWYSMSKALDAKDDDTADNARQAAVIASQVAAAKQASQDPGTNTTGVIQATERRKRGMMSLLGDTSKVGVLS